MGRKRTSRLAALDPLRTFLGWQSSALVERGSLLIWCCQTVIWLPPTARRGLTSRWVSAVSLSRSPLSERFHGQSIRLCTKSFVGAGLPPRWSAKRSCTRHQIVLCCGVAADRGANRIGAPPLPQRWMTILFVQTLSTPDVSSTHQPPSCDLTPPVIHSDANDGRSANHATASSLNASAEGVSG